MLGLTCGLHKISTAKLLEETNMMSINQLNAQIKIMEIWKALNIDGYPLKLDKQTAISINAELKILNTKSDIP